MPTGERLPHRPVTMTFGEPASWIMESGFGDMDTWMGGRPVTWRVNNNIQPRESGTPLDCYVLKLGELHLPSSHIVSLPQAY